MMSRNKTEEVKQALNVNGVYCVRRSYRTLKVTQSRRGDLPVGTIIVSVNGKSIVDFNLEEFYKIQCSTVIQSYEIEPLPQMESARAVKHALPEQPRTYKRARGRFRTVAQEWDYENPCVHCKALYLKSIPKPSRHHCCRFGAFAYSNLDSIFPKLEPLPLPLLNLLTRTAHFSRLSYKYNSLFCIGATSVCNKTGSFEQRFGDHCVTMNGRMYHFIPTAVAAGGKNAISYIVFGGDEAEVIENISAEHRADMQDNVISQLFRMFQDTSNPYTAELRVVGKKVISAAGSAAHPAETMLNAQTSCFHVGSITSDAVDGSLTVRFTMKGNSQFVDGSSEDIEPILYPLFFPFGEQGWGRSSAQNKIPILDYLRSRILMPDIDPRAITNEERFPSLTQQTIGGDRWLPANRFQLAARLKQYYLVDNVSRMIDRRLAWQQKNQSYITGKSHAHLNAPVSAEGDDADDGERIDDGLGLDDVEESKSDDRIYLSDNFTGSSRHRHKLAMNALEIVNQRGKPTVFITCTCNPYWVEIVSVLFAGQTAFDREDVTCMVFHQRLEALLYNLRNGKYFGARTTYVIRVIEYQHRGLPHAHIVVQLEDAPQSVEASVEWIDEHISTHLPIVDDESSMELKKLKELVETQMTHKCSNAVNGCLNIHNICRRGYSNTLLRPISVIDEKGYPVYRRTTEADLKIVPYNSDLLLDWGGHCNVEYCGSSYTVLYLYKYLFKGNKKVDGKVVECGKDEVSAYLTGRMLCSMDAMWRVLGFQNYPRTDPAVEVIKVKNIGISEAILEKGKLNDLYVYFNRPPQLEMLSFLQMFENYTYSRRKPRTTVNYLQGKVEGIRFYLIPRERDNIIVRLEAVNFHSGERWFMRQLLLKSHSRSHIDMMSVDGVQYNTYQEAAIARGIVKDHNEAIIAFGECLTYSTPTELRTMFVMMTIAQHPTIRIWQNAEYVRAMTADYLAQEGNQEIATNFLLQDIKKRLKKENRTMKDYGFPDVQIVEQTEKEHHKIRYNKREQLQLLRQLNSTAPNNLEQQKLFDEIVANLAAKSTTLIFLQGQGGSGKTTFAKKILAHARSQGLVAVGCAATGLAAQVYGNGEFTTAHNLFGIPVQENEEDFDFENDFFQSSISEGSDRYELLTSASLIVWDEFLSNHKHCLDVAHKLTKGFENKVLLCMGDCKQIAPVVKKREPAYTILASMTQSKYWSSFRTVIFSTNMRLLALQDTSTSLSSEQIADREKELAFAQCLLDIGNGHCGLHTPQMLSAAEVEPSLLPYVHTIGLPLIKTLPTVSEVIDFVFPHGIDTPNLHKRAIMAATNDQVDEWNNKIQMMNPADSITLLSTDELADIDDHHGILNSFLTPNVLHKYDVPGVPAHELTLKRGDICLITRNLRGADSQLPLSTNTRVKIVEIKQKCIRVKTLTDSSCFVNIPRITFKFRLSSSQSYYMHRKQYPFKLAYAMTINKSQGQEFDRAVLDLSQSPFTHGLLYVGASRVRHSNNLRIFNCNQIENESVTNIVFTELLSPFQQ